MRRLWLLACLVLLGCETGGTQAPTDGRLRVGLLHPGPISDGSWNAGAYQGLQRIEKELGAVVSQVQVSTPNEFEQGFREYAEQGYDLVFGHGFEFQDAAMEVAEEFPTTTFVVSSGSVARVNVASMRFHLGEATYLAGILAASVSRTGKAGCVGGIRLPVIQGTFDGFAAGARSVDPSFEVVTSYTGSFEDVASAKAATDAMISQGADVVLQNADAAGLGVIQAASEKGIFAIGTNSDQNQVDPDTVVASAVISLPAAFLGVAEEVAEDRFVGRVIQEDLASGVIRFVLNPALAGDLPAGVEERIAAAEKKIRSGEIEVQQ